MTQQVLSLYEIFNQIREFLLEKNIDWFTVSYSSRPGVYIELSPDAFVTFTIGIDSLYSRKPDAPKLYTSLHLSLPYKELVGDIKPVLERLYQEELREISEKAKERERWIELRKQRFNKTKTVPELSGLSLDDLGL